MAPAQSFAPPQSGPGHGQSQVAMQRRAPTMVEMELPAKRSSNQRVAMFAVGGASVALLIIVLVVLLVPSGESADEGRAASAKPSVSAATPPIVAEATTSTGSAVEPPASATDTEPGPTAAPTAAPVAASSKTTSMAARPAATPEARPAAATATAKPAATAPTSAAPPSAGGDGPGTLVAIATGGTCAFSVNGASKGTTNSLKLSVPPGNYNVTCTPSSGASKSRTVTVKSGSTAMAMFKL